MRIHRGALFWGIFFVLLGAIPLADRLGMIDASSYTDVGRWWPLAIIAVGLAILLSRTQLALVGTIAAAVIFGGLVGTAIAVGGGFVLNVGDCTPGNPGDLQRETRDGSLDAGAAVTLDFNCGTLDARAVSGGQWTLDAAYRGGEPVIDASADRLAIRTLRDGGNRRQEWTLQLPGERVRTIDVNFNAGTATLDLTGTHLARFMLDANAGDLVVNAGDAPIDVLDVSMNAGRTRVTLGGATRGSLSVNAGAIDVCAPATAELRLTVREQLTFATNLDQRGLTRDGNVWRRAGNGGPIIELDVSGNAASFNLDPTGGCR